MKADSHNYSYAADIIIAMQWTENTGNNIKITCCCLVQNFSSL